MDRRGLEPRIAPAYPGSIPLSYVGPKCGWQDSNLRLPDPCQVLYRYSNGEGVRLVLASPMFPLSYTHSRSGQIRTDGLRVPNAARYQAALHPEEPRRGWS